MTEDTIPPSHPPVAWHPLARVGFRFILALLVVEQVMPASIWDALVPKLAAGLFDVEIVFRPNGSGDTTYNYVQLLATILIAGFACLIWSLVDRRRLAYPRLAEWLIVGVRYYLAIVMLSYGFAKVFTGQFAAPDLGILTQTIGDTSPMGLAWTFMGYSRAYSSFAGLLEVAGGLLLLSRRTTTLGALVCAGVMTNVVMLNFCFDIPVKLFSTQLLLMALALAAVDGRRLLGVLLLNRATEPRVIEPHFERPRLLLASRVVKGLLIAVLLVSNIYYGIDNERSFGADRPRSPLYGIYEITELREDGELRPDSIPDRSRWRTVIFDSPGVMMVRRIDNSSARYGIDLDLEAGTMTLRDVGDAIPPMFYLDPPESPGPPTYEWRVREGGEGQLELRGELDGQILELQLERSEVDFLLTSRGFHWINERPINR